MTADIDIYRAAKLYIDQHGDQVALPAAMQANALLESRRPRRRRDVAVDHQGDSGDAGDRAGRGDTLMMVPGPRAVSP